MFPDEVSLTKVGSWKWLWEEMTMVNISVEQNILIPLIRRFLGNCLDFFFLIFCMFISVRKLLHREPDSFLLLVMKSCNLIYNHSFSLLASSSAEVFCIL